MSYKGMVKTYGNTQFAGNNLRFATEEEATAYTKNLARGWILVTDWTVRKSEDEVNYTYKDSKLSHLPEAEVVKMADDTVRYERLKGTLQQKKQQFNKQLEKFEKDAEAGKLLSLTDLMINRETIIEDEAEQ